jgi:hypothetical protein
MMRPLFSTSSNADLSVEETLEAPISWEVYPNPTDGIIRVEWNESTPFPGAVCYDSRGRIVANTDGQFVLNLQDVPAGIYFVQLNNSASVVKKVIRY